MFKALRIALLLFILATVAQSAWLARSRAASWETTLFVALYPIAADDAPATTSAVAQLSAADFRPIEAYFEAEAKRHGMALWRPVAFSLAPPLTDQPPQPPREASPVQAILWSLHMRWWAWRHDRIAGPKPAVRLFLLYHDPARTPSLAHSTGLQRGMLGVVNLFADPRAKGSNQVVLAHELLHTLGATDKYDLATNQPRYPDGYANPALEPRLPQHQAELMAGRIPIAADRADIPGSLAQTVVGEATAQEIGWRGKVGGK
jgi:hypothetical protein